MYCIPDISGPSYALNLIFKKQLCVNSFFPANRDSLPTRSPGSVDMQVNKTHQDPMVVVLTFQKRIKKRSTSNVSEWEQLKKGEGNREMRETDGVGVIWRNLSVKAPVNVGQIQKLNTSNVKVISMAKKLILLVRVYFGVFGNTPKLTRITSLFVYIYKSCPLEK